MSIPVFLGLTEEYTDVERARYVILSVPYEETTTHLKGTEYGPAAIIEASQEVELFDDELEFEPFRAGIHTAPMLRIVETGSEKQNQVIYERFRELLEKNKVVCMLGGEHSISYGAVRACLEKHPELTVLQIDAHADLRDGYLGEPFSHAAVMRRIRDLTSKTVGVGIRNYSAEEHEYIKQQKVVLFCDHYLREHPGWADEVVAHLSGDVYLSFDLDGFDPSLVPAVGTPEPGGLGWHDAITLLRKVITKCNLVGFDVVELSPIEGYHSSDFIAARLIYKIIGYHCQRMGITRK